MSNPSIEAKSEIQLETFKDDFPLGTAALESVIKSGLNDKVDTPIPDCSISRTQSGAGPLIFNFPLLSRVGQQLIRLTGADDPRRLLEKKFNCNLYLINCCGIIVTEIGCELTEEDLMSIQFDNQSDVTAHADY